MDHAVGTLLILAGAVCVPIGGLHEFFKALHIALAHQIAGLLPAEHGPECVAAIRELLATDFPDVQWPIEYRTVAADDVWLSPANGRATVTISIHEAVERDDKPYYRAAEQIFRSFGGRPHWGKVHYLQGDDLVNDYARYRDWWRVRDELDPGSVFLNDRLRALRDGE